MNITKNHYQEYLLSDRWKEIRQMVFEKFGRVCAKCGSVNHLQVHHLRYPKILGEETLNDLIVMCQICHKKCHGIGINSEIEIKSGVVYKSWLQSISRVISIIGTNDAYYLLNGVGLLACGENEAAENSFSQIKSEAICESLLMNFRPVIEQNIAKRQGASLGGRPVNYSKNINKFVKKYFPKKYINDEVFKALERWFVYLSENNQATNLQVLESTIEKFSQNVDTQERLLEIIDLNIKHNNLIIDFDIFDLK